MTKAIDTERRLIAIFAADVEGYSRLMGADEVGTMRDLTQRRTILDRQIETHRGRIANTAGDSVLAEFGSAVDAVQCAVEAQAALAEANVALSPDRHINFRIGVHVGDVMVKGGDLFGDSVNIAARLQALASAGGTCISGVAHDQVRKILPFAFSDLGEQQVKNIEEPVRAFAVTTKGSSPVLAVSKASLPLTIPDKPSIAVLPFQNMSGDPEQEYFADGIVEDIITALSRFKSLFVIARNSSFTYKGKVVDIKQVGRELGVRYVLEGSVRKSAGKVRITGQLIDAKTGAHLWADRFDGPHDDIFELQDKVTSNVVAAIAPRLERAEYEKATLKPTDRLDAFDLYYRANQSYWKATRHGYDQALELAQQAILLDPNFAAAYGLATGCFAMRYQVDLLEGKDDHILEGKQYALRAIEFGEDDAFALTRAAHYFGLVLKDAGTADAIIDRALALNPNLAVAWRNRGWISAFLGKHQAAIEQFHHSIRLNPLDPQNYTAEHGISTGHFFLQEFETALSWATKSMARQKTVGAERMALVSYAMLGRIPDAQRMRLQLSEAGTLMTTSQLRKWMPYQQINDMNLYIEACRIAGVPE